MMINNFERDYEIEYKSVWVSLTLTFYLFISTY